MRSDGRRSRGAPKIYLAGPEVFLPNAVEIGGWKKDLCRAYGFEGVFPLDEPPGGSGSVADTGREIFDICVSMMDRCDLCVANLTPFRGISVDVGTAVEIGYMYARGKPVFGYSNSADDYKVRLQASEPGDGTMVEDFGFFDNAMCEGVVARSGGVVRHETDHPHQLTDLQGFEACLARAASGQRA